MSKTKIVMIGGIVLLMTATGFVTYVVENHFDYVRGLEEKVKILDGENTDLEGENLGLKTVLGDRPEPGL